jgi:aspartyl-tRNA(Asn)/glutamyl-tRNA(Gln) amidotransferase subunit A
MDLTALSIDEAAGLLAAKTILPVELTQRHLERIAAVDPTLDAFITVTADQALEQARAAEAARHRGDGRGPLHGIPLALKDLYDTRGVRTTAGAKLFADRVPDADAAVVDRLRAAGMVMLGKLNMHECALGVTNDNPHFGACKNPWSLDRITGGSSGGSAAALAAGLCLGSLGSDTGGSIRIPASLCGIVGLKPTRGRVSLRGAVPLSWNLDHAGPMARRVRDVAILLEAIAGYDPEDPASADVPNEDWLAGLDGDIIGWRIGLAGSATVAGVETAVRDAVQKAALQLESLGAVIEQVELPDLATAAPLNGLMTTADAAAFHHERMERAPDQIGADVLARLRRGAAVSARAYILAREEQARLRRRFERWFTGFGGRYDVVAMPATACVAPRRDGLDAVAVAPVLTRFTSPFNFTGLPALSVPCGFSPDGLPIGLQIVAPPWKESRALRVGHVYEQSTDWHRATPPLV